jgi:hypothetical protein
MPDLITPQPDPIKNDLPASWDLVVEDFRAAHGAALGGTEVIADMRGRDQFGHDKYGVRIQPFNGRDNLIDAYQELLDSLVYFRSALFEQDDDVLMHLYQHTLKTCLTLRQVLMQRDGE